MQTTNELRLKDNSRSRNAFWVAGEFTNIHATATKTTQSVLVLKRPATSCDASGVTGSVGGGNRLAPRDTPPFPQKKNRTICASYKAFSLALGLSYQRIFSPGMDEFSPSILLQRISQGHVIFCVRVLKVLLIV